MGIEFDEIVGNKVNLRPICLDDTPLILKWRNNPNVMRNFICRETFTEEMHKNWMNTKVANGEVIQYIIELTTTGKPVGSVYLRDINMNHRSAEYGIFIGEDAVRGKGIGSETATLFTNYMFETLKLHRIFLRVLKGNNSAYKSYLNAGFVEEGIGHEMVILDGEYKDVIFMSIINKKED
ncbi:MAG: UDP-4-amino-4,6-dideoxy-N-acetyl-beta-L-altrosamine N-acetyltransferase [Lachnospiraceae bacterium]|nr:UDP-4-amino-4,6-dideoxy-N-acetyl-beta-L-altrosamine N-acetyltransferase [Lachnospiraceae bacterium]